jgi:DNA-binding transcriptional ArsR family regulator
MLGRRNAELIHKETLSPSMVAILSALRECELRYTDLKSRLINPERNKPYTDRALSLSLGILKKRGLVERPDTVGHRPYRITMKGVEEILKAEECSFIRQNNFYKAFDIKTYAPIPPPLRSSVFGYVDEWISRPDSSGRLENLDTPETIVSDYPPIFPLSTRAVVKLSENGKLALEPWLQRMRGRYGIDENDETEQEWLHEEIVDIFADPIIKKLCEIVFERTRVLSAIYSEKDVGGSKERHIPTLRNIMNFNFEFALRYSGENWLKSASDEEVKNAQHLLAGMILLYLAGEGGGPLMSFVWHPEEIDVLVKTQVLTKEEVSPLLETCEEVPAGLGKFLGAHKLSEVNKRRLTISAYRRFYLGGLFGDCARLSWEERLELLPFMKVFQRYMSHTASLEEYSDIDAFNKDRLIKESSKVLFRPEAEMENHFAKLTELKVFTPIKEELGIYRWNKDPSFTLFGQRSSKSTPNQKPSSINQPSS